MSHRPGEMLKRWRYQAGMNQKEMAVKLRCSTPNVCRLESGQGRPSAHLANRIQRVTKGEVPAESWLEVKS